jgi:4-hydroxybenzoate polyprenyltransferase
MWRRACLGRRDDFWLLFAWWLTLGLVALLPTAGAAGWDVGATVAAVVMVPPVLAFVWSRYLYERDVRRQAERGSRALEMWLRTQGRGRRK